MDVALKALRSAAAVTDMEARHSPLAVDADMAVVARPWRLVVAGMVGVARPWRSVVAGMVGVAKPSR